MLDLIDRDVTPDPFNPQPGDVYTRLQTQAPDSHKPGDTLPRRVVVHDIYTDGSVRFTVDGGLLFASKKPAEFRRYLASIVGLSPTGRVRTKPGA